MEFLDTLDEALDTIIEITEKVAKIAAAGVIIVEAFGRLTSNES